MYNQKSSANVKTLVDALFKIKTSFPQPSKNRCCQEFPKLRKVCGVWVKWASSWVPGPTRIPWPPMPRTQGLTGSLLRRERPPKEVSPKPVGRKKPMEKRKTQKWFWARRRCQNAVSDDLHPDESYQVSSLLQTHLFCQFRMKLKSNVRRRLSRSFLGAEWNGTVFKTSLSFCLYPNTDE